MEITDIIANAPMLVFPITAWLVYRVHTLEVEVLQAIKSDITELKTDIRWLVDAHKQKGD
jgi:hypothetical protein